MQMKEKIVLVNWHDATTDFSTQAKIDALEASPVKTETVGFLLGILKSNSLLTALFIGSLIFAGWATMQHLADAEAYCQDQNGMHSVAFGLYCEKIVWQEPEALVCVNCKDGNGLGMDLNFGVWD